MLNALILQNLLMKRAQLMVQCLIVVCGHAIPLAFPIPRRSAASFPVGPREPATIFE